MPAMWDNKKTATGPSAHQLPPPELKKRQFLRPNQTLPLSKSTSSVNKLRNSDEDQDRAFWQNDFDNRLNGLGIQNGPFKYEIRRGKTVLQPDVSGPRQLSPPLDSDDLRVRAPPRNQRLKADDEVHGHWRPTSSIYGDEDDSSNNHSRSHSQSRPRRKPSSTGRSKAKAPAKDMYGRPTAIEISPPSSPEFDAARNGGNHEDVSPIDEAPDMSQLELLQDARHTPSPQSHAHPRSQIPTMRRDKTRDQDQRPSPLRESKSIDQLRDQEKHGKHPWQGAAGQQASSKPPHTFGLTTTVTGPRALRPSNPPTTFGQRMRKLRLKAEPVENRPPWNGASGRAPLVEPVRDDPSVAPLSLQRRVSKRVGLGGGTSPESPSGAASTVRRLLPSRSNQKLKDASKTPSPEPTSQAGTSHAYPSPPYSSSPPQPPVASHAARPVHAAPLLTPSTMPDQQKAIKRKPSPSAHMSQASYSSSVYSALTEQTASGPAPLPNNLEPTSLFAPEDPWVQPPSRFSVTTCNTAAPESPRLTDDEDRPPLPTTPKPPSMMDRRRPVPGGDSFKRASNDPIIISMKTSSMSLRSDAASQDRTSTERPPSILVTDKALPLAPPEMQSANDRVAYLTARLDSLAHRRTNINKSIKQMTELMPTDNLLASADVIRRRETEKKKVEGLKEELAEIQREEYDLGLKLYRANKRLEREAAFEPSSLWVRRVTS